MDSTGGLEGRFGVGTVVSPGAVVLEQVESHAPGRFQPHARQAAQRLDQRIQGMGLGHHTVALGGGGRAGPDIDLVGLALGMFCLRTGRDGLRQCLGVTGSGKAAHADIDTVGNQGGGLFGRHDAREEFWVTYAICDGHCMLQTQRPRPGRRA